MTATRQRPPAPRVVSASRGAAACAAALSIACPCQPAQLASSSYERSKPQRPHNQNRRKRGKSVSAVASNSAELRADAAQLQPPLQWQAGSTLSLACGGRIRLSPYKYIQGGRGGGLRRGGALLAWANFCPLPARLYSAVLCRFLSIACSVCRALYL